MATIPEELRPWVEMPRQRIDQATPQVTGTWNRTEIATLAAVCWFQGFAEALSLSDSTPGIPAGIADDLSASPEIKGRIIGMCQQIAEALIDEVDGAA